MKDYFALLSMTYYTMAIMHCVQLFALIVALTHRKRFPILKYYHLYVVAAFAQSIIGVIGVCFPDEDLGWNIQQISINLFALTEVYLFYQISLKSHDLSPYRKLLYLILAGFAIYCAGIWLHSEAFFENAEKIYLAEAGTMLIPACFYFINVFRMPVSVNLFHQPLFWINLGILVTFFVILPLNIVEHFSEKFISTHFYFYQITYLAYSVLYLSVVKAYLCPKVTGMTLKKRTPPADTLSVV